MSACSLRAKKNNHPLAASSVKGSSTENRKIETQTVLQTRNKFYGTKYLSH